MALLSLLLPLPDPVLDAVLEAEPVLDDSDPEVVVVVMPAPLEPPLLRLTAAAEAREL